MLVGAQDDEIEIRLRLKIAGEVAIFL